MDAPHGHWLSVFSLKAWRQLHCTRMLRAVLKKSWKQHPTKQWLYGHLPPISKTIRIRRTKHAGHCWRNKGELTIKVLLGNLSHGRAGVGREARTCLQLLSTDTGCSLEERSNVTGDRDEWHGRVIGTTWWWWWC